VEQIGYERAPVSVREDLTEAHRRAWERLARPGSWWTGSERVAIAVEVRGSADCALCRERAQALSPNAVDGEHTSLGVLPASAVDVVHRVTRDPGRLSRAWFERVQAAGLSDGHYVELIGVVVGVVSIDSFCRGLGAPLHPLPRPLEGEPTRYRPASAVLEDAWVPMIPSGKAQGPEQGLFGPGRRTGNVIRALSLVPDAVRQLLDMSAAHYMAPQEMMDLTAGRTIDRLQIELVAGRVSALRECFY
jgi:hypothetical protein